MFLLTMSVVALAAAGSLEGTVTIRKAGEPVSSRNALVFLEGRESPPPEQPAEMTQTNRTFSPSVLPVVRRQWVEFVNAEPEPIYHQVFSPSEAVKRFDTGKYKPPQRRKVQFSSLGRVDVFCDIHKEMLSTIYVVPNRHFVVIEEDAKGATFRMEGVPSGTYTLVVWHRSSDVPVRQKVVVKAGETTKIDSILEAGSGLEDLLSRHKNRNGKDYTEDQRAREKDPW